MDNICLVPLRHTVKYKTWISGYSASQCYLLKRVWLYHNVMWIAASPEMVSRVTIQPVRPTQPSNLYGTGTEHLKAAAAVLYAPESNCGCDITLTMNQRLRGYIHPHCNRLRGQIKGDEYTIYNPEQSMILSTFLQGRRFESRPFRFLVTTLDKLFTHLCFCHQAV